MMSPGIDSTVSVTRALAHPARLRILAALRTGELCVCQITEVLGLAPSTVSAHLRELKLARLVTERKEGRWVHMRLSDEPSTLPWIETALSAIAKDPQPTNDDALVRELRGLPVETLCKFGLDEARRRHRQTRTKEDSE
jgi:arsenate reductase/ArsR family transcriptional regulator